MKKKQLELSLTNKRPTPNLPGVNGKKEKIFTIAHQSDH
jgi:hypothetical protein